jgi:hypothetical protein
MLLCENLHTSDAVLTNLPRLWWYFISHATAEKDDIQRLRRALNDRGIETWEDALQLRLGDKLADLEKAVKDADAFVVLLSPSSIGSDRVHILDGDRNPALADGPALDPDDAPELSLLLASLGAS